MEPQSLSEIQSEKQAEVIIRLQEENAQLRKILENLLKEIRQLAADIMS